MSGSVIVRGETRIVDGRIYHDDTPLPWAEADKRAGFRLDRRRAWAFVEGELCESVHWTHSCSGCAYGFEERGGGCHECGYHGVVRDGMWVPATITASTRDSGSEAKPENSRSEVEPEGAQSGRAKTRHRPTPVGHPPAGMK